MRPRPGRGGRAAQQRADELGGRQGRAAEAVAASPPLPALDEPSLKRLDGRRIHMNGLLGGTDGRRAAVRVGRGCWSFAGGRGGGLER
jgi:hypothetical protein